MPLKRFLACLAAIALVPASLLAQQSKTDIARAALIASLNRIHLYSPGSAWHMTIHVQIVKLGKPGDKGTVDLYRNAQGELRSVFAFPNFHQTRYTAKDTLIEGDAGDPPAGLDNFIHFFDTSEHTERLRTAPLTTFEIRRTTVNFHCTRATFAAEGAGPTYCNIVGSQPLRYNTIGGSFVTLFEDITIFEGGDAPTRATIFFQYQPIARLSISYTPLEPGDREMHPPPNAVPRSTLSEDLNTLLNHKLIDPFAHPGPTLIAPPNNGAVLFRLELSNGRVENIEALAESDATTFQDVSAHIHKVLAKDIVPPGHTFINYSYSMYLIHKNADANEAMPNMDTLD